MNILSRLRLWFVALVIFVFVGVPQAEALSDGGSTVGVARYGEEHLRALALKINTTLDADKVNVAIIARSGRLRSDMPRGINYTHTAFIVFEPVRGQDGKISHTYTVYNLYQGGPGEDNRSYLKQDFTYNFVAGIAEPDIAVCVPTEALQKRLLSVIRSPAYKALHNPDYNLLTNPWVDRFDNCVTHTLKVCVAAIYKTDDRTRIYGILKKYFKPTPVSLGLGQTFGSFFMSSVSREDEDRSGLQTATYDSLRTFLEENGLVQKSFLISLEKTVVVSDHTP